MFIGIYSSKYFVFQNLKFMISVIILLRKIILNILTWFLNKLLEYLLKITVVTAEVADLSVLGFKNINIPSNIKYFRYTDDVLVFFSFFCSDLVNFSYIYDNKLSITLNKPSTTEARTYMMTKTNQINQIERKRSHCGDCRLANLLFCSLI